MTVKIEESGGCGGVIQHLRGMRRGLSEREVADIRGVSAKMLQRERVSGDGPPYVKYSHKVVYLPEDLAAWLEQRRRTSTQEGR